MTRIVFAHGNSFPGATYSVLFAHLRQRGFTVSAVDRFGHEPQYPFCPTPRNPRNLPPAPFGSRPGPPPPASRCKRRASRSFWQAIRWAACSV